MNDVICTRRSSSYWTHCECPPCKADFLRKVKLHRNGRYSRVASSDAWAVIDLLRSRDWSASAIATAAGLLPRSLQSSIHESERGHRGRLGPEVSRRIVNYGDPTTGRVGSVGSTRRLQGLAIQGYDLTTLVGLTGIPSASLSTARLGYKVHVRATTYVALKNVTTAIGMTHGPSHDAHWRAAQKGWPGLLAWDEDTIDDPDAAPIGGRPRASSLDEIAVERAMAGESVELTRSELEEACRRMAAAGMSRAQVAARLGTTARTLQRWDAELRTRRVA